VAAQRVLVLHSLREVGSERRARQMADSPRLQGFTIEHFYITDHVDPSSDVNLASWPTRLGMTIDRFRADIVLVHIGMAYYGAPARYINIINELVRMYPSVRFVADKYLLDEERFAGARPGDNEETDRLILAFGGL
jgi:hypothetical protein